MLDAATLPLLGSRDAAASMVWRRSGPISRSAFLTHVRRLMQDLPRTQHVVNLCEDRYLFLVAFAAVIANGKTNLLPPSRTRGDLGNVNALYPDSEPIADADVEAIVGSPLRQSESTENEVCENPEIATHHTAVIAFTSGSTGQPRAHVKRWGDLVRHARCAEQRFGFRRKRAIIVATVPAQHMYGLETSVMVPLVCGAGVYGGRPFYAEDVRAALNGAPAPRALITTPIHLRVCVASGLEWPAVEFIISATAPLSETLGARAERVFGAPVMEIYGCTEAGSLASRRRIDGDLWRTYDDTVVQAAGDGFVARAAHLPEPTPLGDVLVLHDETRFELAGRQSDLVNVAGKRASLGDLNLKLNDIDGVHDAAFIAPDDETDEAARLQALVVAPGLAESEILSRLAERIDPAFMPRPLFKVDRLPRNELGKLPRAELLNLVRQLRARGRPCGIR